MLAGAIVDDPVNGALLIATVGAGVVLTLVALLLWRAR